MSAAFTAIGATILVLMAVAAADIRVINALICLGRNVKRAMRGQ